MLNRVVLVGRITKDPELRKTQSGLSTIAFLLACNRRVSKDSHPQADFINCVAWRQTADYMANYVKKGALLGIEGRIQTRNYQDRDGKKVYVTEIICDSVQTLARATEKSAGASYGTAQTNIYQAPTSEQYVDYDGVPLDISPDDLPF
ncbi:single-stranded DNA-binding protein [Dielma fastidiosa]|uniref:single-stranded DNA-binding protein n=1 Tax=Dielma fastidiosa TaxID=1034346 RepID=UPI003563F4D6